MEKIDGKWLLEHGFQRLKSGFSITDEQYSLYKPRDFYIYVNLNFPMLRCHNYKNKKQIVMSKDNFNIPFNINELENILQFLEIKKTP